MNDHCIGVKSKNANCYAGTTINGGVTVKCHICNKGYELKEDNNICVQI